MTKLVFYSIEKHGILLAGFTTAQHMAIGQLTMQAIIIVVIGEGNMWGAI